MLADSTTVTAHREPVLQQILFSVILKAVGYKHPGSSGKEGYSPAGGNGEGKEEWKDGPEKNNPWSQEKVK